MAVWVPSYYRAFHCIADRCRHSCCVGWEVDIDPESLRRYEAVTGALGEALQAHIVRSEAGGSFRLTPEERCPFLQEDGLCRLYRELGEESLCQICTDHPRFRSYFTGRTELGLGMCCEEAARVALTHTVPATWVLLEQDSEGEESLPPEEAFLLTLRERLTALLQDRRVSLPDRLDNLLEAAHIALPASSMAAWAKRCLSLERLDDHWTEALNRLANSEPSARPSLWKDFALPLEQWAVYLLWRHLPEALEASCLLGRIAFVAWGVAFVHALLQVSEESSMDTLLDLCRMFSAEIEYSDENLTALVEAFEETLSVIS